jgi:hypothetical protein
MRRAIQIAVAAAPCEPTVHPAFIEIVALCDDGAIFTGTGSANGELSWQQLPPIPQPEIAADEVVMPKVDDIILVSNYQLGISGYYKFCGIIGHEVKVSYDQEISYWNFWRYNESDLWRDASGKIV